MRTVAVMLALLVLIMPISGCFGEEPVQSPEPEGPFSTLGEIPETTWYHYSGGINALDPVAVLRNWHEHLRAYHRNYLHG